jgi:hypothetical protein
MAAGWFRLRRFGGLRALVRARDGKKLRLVARE